MRRAMTALMLSTLSVFAAAPALATTPTGVPAAATTTCEPDGESACIGVLVLDPENNRIADAEVTVSGPEGFEETITTTDEGLPAVSVTATGKYTAVLDPTTLPEGDELGEDVSNEVIVTAQMGGTARAAFRVGEDTAVTPTETETATGEGGLDGDGGAPAATSGGLKADQVWTQIGSGLRFGLLLALASVGLSLIYGTTKLSSFSHGEQVTLGAMLAYVTMNVMGMPIWLGAIVTLALCAATGWAQDAGIWKPLRKRGTPVVQLMIVTIGLSIALQYFIQLAIGAGTQRIITSNPQTWTLGPFELTRASWVSMVIALVVLFAVAWFLTRTRIGQATRAVSDNTALASATGIDPNKIIRIVWVLATTLAGLAGMLLGMVFGSFNWMMGMQMLLLMFAAVTLGGLGTAFGALVGSLVIGMVVELSNLVIPSDLRYASALLILILVLVFRPQGLLGRRERIG